MLQDMPFVVLQMCDPSKTGPEYLTEFQFVEAFTCTFANAAGLLVVGMMVFGSIQMAIYLTTGDIRIPAVLTLLTGGAVIPMVAAPAVAIAAITVLLVGAGVVTYLYYRYSR